MRILFISVIFCLSLLKLQAQDVLAEKMRINGLVVPSAKLFVHFDKNVYSSNEMAWFTAYLLQEQKELIDKHTVLAVSLIRGADSALVLQEKFVMGEGLSFGNMIIPNFLPNGEYHFMVFTNVVVGNKPAVVFTQRITLKTNIIPNLKANISFQKTPVITDKEAKLLFKVTSSEDKLLPRSADVTYQLGNYKGNGITDTFGQLAIAIPFEAINNDTIVKVKVKYEKDSALVNIALPVFKRSAKLSFYPEGGYLVDQIPGYVAFEIKDQFGQPIQTQAILFKDNTPVDTLQSNYYGMGKFVLVPTIKSNYSVRLLFDKLIDSTYVLPQILASGVSVSINEAVVTDTLNLTVRGNLTGNYNLRLHNFKESYTYSSIYLNKMQRLKIPLNHLPKGLFTITLSDSLNRPLADRMAFAHYDTIEKVKIETDKQVYKPREKVTLKLSLDSGLLEGVFSVAVVQQSRLSSRNRTDIESYAYLESELGNLPINAIGSPYKDKAFLEDMLRVKGWSRYTWLKLNSIKPADTIKNYSPMEITGYVTKNEKPLTKALSLGITIDTTFSLLPTDALGKFVLPMDNLIAESGKKAYVFLAKGSNELMKIKLNDPYTALAKNNIKELWPNYSSLPINTTNVLPQKIGEQSILLNEVAIKSNIINEKFGKNEKLELGPNACGDYVCEFGILNCPYHTAATSPVKGKSYAIVNKINKDGFDVVLYKGCLILDKEKQSLFTSIPILYVAKEFYVNEYKDKKEPAISSTLYWNHYVKLINNNSLKLTFFASNIEGEYKIVVQGIVDNKTMNSFSENIVIKN
jgi:hypothetical protein